MRRRVLAGLAAALVVVGVTACSTKEPTQTGPQGDPIVIGSTSMHE